MPCPAVHFARRHDALMSPAEHDQHQPKLPVLDALDGNTATASELLGKVLNSAPKLQRGRRKLAWRKTANRLIVVTANVCQERILADTASLQPTPLVAVVIPCYRVTRHILEVLARIGPEVTGIYCVDDGCPDGSGRIVEEQSRDPRVKVLRHSENRGVGGATITGYRAALAAGYDIVLKIDGDGQMDPASAPSFIAPIRQGWCDYTKGNRFFHSDVLRRMPPIRLVGNAGLSILTKMSSGYWNIIDPTNGYTAIHADVLRELPLGDISNRYFFESDMLFHLNILGAVAVDIPMPAHYGDEHSGLSAMEAIPEFFILNVRNFFRRLLLNYLIRDFNIATIQTLFGVLLLCFGLAFGSEAWVASAATGMATSAGTIMLAALPIILGMQFLLAAVAYDIQSVPTRTLHLRLTRQR